MTMQKLMTMRRCLEDERYLGHDDMLGAPSWAAWRVVLLAAMGEPLTDDERVIFTKLTERESEPEKPVKELWAIVGRRGGKSRAIAALGTYLSACIDYRGILAPGQVGNVPIISASREQAGEIYNYACGIFAEAPGFSGLLATAPTANTITLKSRIEIQIRTGSFRRARGFTACAVIGDEVSFWSSESSANPDKEILNAVRPALGTTHGPLIAISSPYAKKGEVYGTYRKHFGAAGRDAILVVKAPTKTTNPTFDSETIAQAYADDPAAAASEYGAEFRDDVSDFVSREAIDALVDRGVKERGPLSSASYVAFVDPSGGASDSMTLAIGHKEGDKAVIDATRERLAPFSPEDVVKDFAELLKSYRIYEVEGDRYAGEWPRERFRVHGIGYRPAEHPKSDLYRNALPSMNSGSVRLLDNERLVVQLVSLERRTSRAGRDSIDHPPNQHDDLANVVAGVVSRLRDRTGPPEAYVGRYQTVRSSARADRIDRLPVETAIQLGLCSEETAIRNKWLEGTR